MNLAVSSQLGRELAAVTVREAADFAIRHRRALKRVDKELSRGNFQAALNLVEQLQGKPGGLRGFGAAKQVPRDRVESYGSLCEEDYSLTAGKSIQMVRVQKKVKLSLK